MPTVTASTGGRYTEISWTARKIVAGRHQQVRPGPDLTQRHQREEHEGDQTQHERDKEYAVQAGGELEGYGVVDPGRQR